MTLHILFLFIIGLLIVCMNLLTNTVWFMLKTFFSCTGFVYPQRSEMDDHDAYLKEAQQRALILKHEQIFKKCTDFRFSIFVVFFSLSFFSPSFILSFLLFYFPLVSVTTFVFHFFFADYEFLLHSVALNWMLYVWFCCTAARFVVFVQLQYKMLALVRHAII